MSDSRAMWWESEGLTQLSELLRRVWDPVGVGDEPEGVGEYNSEAVELSEQLDAGASVEQIEVALRANALGHPKTSDRDAAVAVVSWYEQATQSAGP